MKRRKAVLYILVAGFMIVLVGVLLFLWIYFASMREMHQTTRNFYEQPFTVSNAAQALESHLHQIRSDLLYATLIQADSVHLINTVAVIKGHELAAQEKISSIAHNYSGDPTQLPMLKQHLQALDEMTELVIKQLADGHYAQANTLLETAWNARFAKVAELNAALLAHADLRAMNMWLRVKNAWRVIPAEGSPMLRYWSLYFCWLVCLLAGAFISCILRQSSLPLPIF